MSLSVTISQFDVVESTVVPSATLRSIANYLFALCGIYGLRAQQIVTGGGVVVTPSIPGTGVVSTVYPFIITSSDFNADGISYDNPDIVGDNLTIFVNEYAQQWLVAGPTTFSYSSSGLIMNIPGWDSNTQSWTILIQKLNS